MSEGVGVGDCVGVSVADGVVDGVTDASGHATLSTAASPTTPYHDTTSAASASTTYTNPGFRAPAGRARITLRVVTEKRCSAVPSPATSVGVPTKDHTTRVAVTLSATGALAVAVARDTVRPARSTSQLRPSAVGTPRAATGDALAI